MSREAEIRARLEAAERWRGEDFVDPIGDLTTHAPTDLAWLLDRVAALEAERAAVVAELRERAEGHRKEAACSYRLGYPTLGTEAEGRGAGLSEAADLVERGGR